MKKATNVSEVFFTCTYKALDSTELESFYVDTSKARGVDVLQRLKKSFEYVPNIYQQVLFLGHIGSGKSTLLYQLEKLLKSKYTVIRFSVQNMLDTQSITFADLLCVMYERVLYHCKDLLDENEEELKAIYNSWNSIITKESSTYSDIDNELNAEAGVGIKTFLAKVFASFTSALKFGSQEKETISNTIVKNINDHINNLNSLLDLVLRKTNKPVLFMFEDLEKISRGAATDLFINKASYFKRIKSHMLLTTPIYLKYKTEFQSIITQNFASSERCPIIAVTDSNYKESSVGVETMREIIYARVSEELIEETALNKAILHSGGLIRDLLYLLREAARSCNSGVITERDIELAFQVLQDRYLNELRESQVNTILRVYNNPRCLVQDDDELELMRAEVIIEYNCEQWRGIHPAVIKGLDKRGYPRIDSL